MLNFLLRAMRAKNLIPLEGIERRIYMIGGHKVMLDSDLAAIYGVSTKRLNEQVKRNAGRFPTDFMFRLTKEETQMLQDAKLAPYLKSQIATSRWGGRRYFPIVFTEHGAVMLASVLNSPTAIQASVQVVRAFVKLREIVSAHKELAVKLTELERKVEGHDEHIQSLFDAIRELMEPPVKPKPQIGFQPHKK